MIVFIRWCGQDIPIVILPNAQAPTNGLLAKAKKVHFYDFNIKIPYKLNIFYIDGFHYKKIKAFKIHCISLVLITTYEDDNTILV